MRIRNKSHDTDNDVALVFSRNWIRACANAFEMACSVVCRFVVQLLAIWCVAVDNIYYKSMEVRCTCTVQLWTPVALSYTRQWQEQTVSFPFQSDIWELLTYDMHILCILCTHKNRHTTSTTMEEKASNKVVRKRLKLTRFIANAFKMRALVARDTQNT